MRHRLTECAFSLLATAQMDIHPLRHSDITVSESSAQDLDRDAALGRKRRKRVTQVMERQSLGEAGLIAGESETSLPHVPMAEGRPGVRREDEVRRLREARRELVPAQERDFTPEARRAPHAGILLRL